MIVMSSALLTNSSQDDDMAISCLPHQRQHALDNVDDREESGLELLSNERSGARRLRELFDCADERYSL
jgi:hypothetical protein